LAHEKELKKMKINVVHCMLIIYSCIKNVVSYQIRASINPQTRFTLKNYQSVLVDSTQLRKHERVYDAKAKYSMNDFISIIDTDDISIESIIQAEGATKYWFMLPISEANIYDNIRLVYVRICYLIL